VPEIEVQSGPHLSSRVHPGGHGVPEEGHRCHIEDGRTRKIGTGECQGRGKPHCEGFLLARQEWKKLKIPGSIDLGDGIEI
jgi:hypothetical protein